MIVTAVMQVLLGRLILYNDITGICPTTKLFGICPTIIPSSESVLRLSSESVLRLPTNPIKTLLSSLTTLLHPLLPQSLAFLSIPLQIHSKTCPLYPLHPF